MAGLTIQQQLEEAQRFGLSLDEARTARSCGLTYEQYAASKASGGRRAPTAPTEPEPNAGLSERELKVAGKMGLTPEQYAANKRQPSAPEDAQATRAHMLGQLAHYSTGDPAGIKMREALTRMASETGGNG